MASKQIFQWSLKRLSEIIALMILDKFDCFIVIEGNRGLGKSTLAWHLMRKSYHHKFNPYKDLLYKQEDVLKFFAEKWYSSGMADEMINVSFNRDFYSTGQKDLIKLMNMNRDHCNLFIACVPQFSALDTQIKSLCKIRITVVERGKAILHTQNKSIFSTDKWDMKNNERIERLWSQKKVKPVPKYSQLSTFRGVINFPKLSKKDQALYDKIKREQRNEIWEDAIKSNEVGWGKPKIKVSPTDFIYKLVQSKKLNNKNFDDYCIALDIRPMSMREMIRKRLRDDGIKEKLSEVLLNNNKSGEEMPKKKLTPMLPRTH